MKTKFKGLFALWLALALAITMLLPISAEGSVQDFDLRIYTGDTPLEVGDRAQESNIVSYTPGTALNKLDTTGSDVADLSGISGWKVWSFGYAYYGQIYYCETELEPDAVISEGDYDVSDYIFEPIRTGELRRIVKQPTSTDLSVEVNYAEDVVIYQWYEITDEGGSEITHTYTNVSAFIYDGDYDAELGAFTPVLYPGTDQNPYRLDVMDIFAPKGATITVTIVDGTAVEVYDWYDETPYAYEDGSYTFVADKTTVYNPIVVSDTSFAAVITVTAKYLDEEAEPVVVEPTIGTYDELLYKSDENGDGKQSIALDINLNSTTQIVKVTPEAGANVYVNDQSDSTSFVKIGDSFYSFPNAYGCSLYVCANNTDQEAFTASVEILDANTGIKWLYDEYESELKTVKIGTKYYCKIYYSDGYMLTSKTVRAAEDMSLGGNMFLILLALKQNFRYYDGDTLVARQRIVRGEVNEALTLENKDGLALEGWYTDKELTEKYDFSQPVTTGAMLFAKWVDASEIVTPEDTTEDATEDATEVTE